MNQAEIDQRLMWRKETRDRIFEIMSHSVILQPQVETPFLSWLHSLVEAGKQF